MARAAARRECAAAVTSPRKKQRRRVWRSARCTPCALTVWASLTSAPISSVNLRRRHAAFNLKASALWFAPPKCRKINPVPRGGRPKAPRGSGVRAGSVSNSSAGSPEGAFWLRPEAIAANRAPLCMDKDFSPASARAAILAKIAAAAKAAGRDPGAVTLVAVSKTQPQERVRGVLQTGQTVFGENRVQEAIMRWTDLRQEFPKLKLRLIGPLQTNKAKQAVAFFDAIDSLDRDKLARALADEIQRQGRALDCLIQVNTGEEPQKAGVAPKQADAFIARCRDLFGLPVKGLMCVPPEGEEAAMHFTLLSKIAARNGLKELSMGMSGDFETAIRFGATMVRVGSALFGPRG